MDDLTKIKGIGKATAKRLVDAGIDSFAALAAATPEQFQAVEKLSGEPADWSEWVARANSLAPAAAPVNLETASAEQLGDHAARIDAARAKVAAAGEAAAAAQASGDAEAIEQARLAALAAAAELDGLIGPGDTEIPAGSHVSGEGQSEAAAPAPRSTDAGLGGGETATMETAPKPDAVASASGTNSEHNPESDDDQEGGAGNPAGPAESVEADFIRVISQLSARVNFLIDHEGVDAARAFVQEERGHASALARQVAALQRELERHDAEIQSRIDQVERTTITVTGPKKGRWRAGHHFGPEKITVEVSLSELELIAADASLDWSIA